MPLRIALPPSEVAALRAALVADFDAVVDMLVRVQAERAEASSPADKEMIFRRIREGTGEFVAFNNRVKTQMRAWALETALGFVRDDEQTGRAESADHVHLLHNVAVAMRKLGQAAQSRDLLLRARALCAKLAAERALLAKCTNALGVACSVTGKTTNIKKT